MKKSQLIVQDVSQTFSQAHNTITVLNHVNATFEQGKSYAIVGVSGTGKSTLLQLLAGLASPDTGSIFYNGKNIAQMSESERHRFFHASIGIIFQAPSLIDEFSVIENIMLKGLIVADVQKQTYDHAKKLLALIGLADKAEAAPATLSGGESQRVALARAVFYKPDFLIADEPTAHLDGANKQSMLELMLEFQKMYGMGLIIATHDLAVAERMQVCIEIVQGKLHGTLQ